MTTTQKTTYITALVAYANTSLTGGFVYNARRVTPADINSDVARLVKSGAIIETPGDPYTWAVA